MEDGIERELQFGCADVEAVAAWLGRQPAHAALRFVAEGDKTQRDTYFDTEGWALLRGGFSLRVRRKGEAAEATLKATTKRAAGPQMRREISQKVESEAALGDGEGPVGTRVRLMTAGRALQPLFEIETRRRVFGVLQGSERIAEISLDETVVLRAVPANSHEGAAASPDAAPTPERGGLRPRG